MSQKYGFAPSADKARDNIKVGHLVKLLHDDAMGKISLSNGRRKSAEILLKKCMPDLSTMTMTDTDGNSMPVSVTLNF